MPLRQRQEWVFKGGMRAVVRGGGEDGGGDSQAELNLSFLPQGCAAAAAAAVALCLKTD